MKYNLVVIGSGPGGYVAAIRAAQLGLKVAIVEKYATLGGTCLNVGCIPSKALLDSTEHYYNAAHSFKTHGIELSNLKPNMLQMIARKNDVVKQNTEGINYLMKKNKIDVFVGVASFITKNSILISGKKEETIETEKVIIATGSKPATLPFITVDKKRILTSTEMLNLTQIPKHLVLIGGGVIGLELGSVFARLGSKVTVLEFMDSITPTMDKTLSKELQKSLTKIGFEFLLSHQVKAVSSNSKEVVIKATDKSGKEVTITSDYCLVAVGRKAFTEGLALEKIGIQTEERSGKIAINKNMETVVPGIFAIGDVVRGAMLAHKAEEEGVYVAEFIAGQKPHINYNLIPNVIYTWPEVAAVGKTEEELKAEGVLYKSGSFPFLASGRARASMDTDGLVKVLTDAKTDEILGVHMIGPRVADMIAEAVLAMEFRASAEDVARISHAHPTYTEVFKEACLAATANRAIHI